MKFINNHPDQFDEPVIAFLISWLQLVINIAAEFLNLYMLLWQHSVEHAIIHFVAMEVIIEIPHFYTNALIDDKLKDKIF